MTTMYDPDQLEAALDELFHQLVASVENPGVITMDNVGVRLRNAVRARERQGDYGAAHMLDAYAMEADDGE